MRLLRRMQGVGWYYFCWGLHPVLRDVRGWWYYLSIGCHFPLFTGILKVYVIVLSSLPFVRISLNSIILLHVIWSLVFDCFIYTAPRRAEDRPQLLYVSIVGVVDDPAMLVVSVMQDIPIGIIDSEACWRHMDRRTNNARSLFQSFFHMILGVS